MRYHFYIKTYSKKPFLTEKYYFDVCAVGSGKVLGTSVAFLNPLDRNKVVVRLASPSLTSTVDPCVVET